MKDHAIRDDEDLRTVSDPVWRILTGAAAFGAGVFVCGSVGSYVPSDPSWNAATDASVQNLFGNRPARSLPISPASSSAGPAGSPASR
jgi:DNA segregation ATPase FtsK/SpoIIIE, S-DNA-T family